MSCYTIATLKRNHFYQKLFFSQPCLPIYVSELKLAFSLAMAIQFGSGIFWVRLSLFSFHIQTLTGV